MKVITRSFVFILAVALAAVACGDITAPEADSGLVPEVLASELYADTMAQIHTAGVYIPGTDSRLELTASMHWDGRVTGVAVVPQGLHGSPVEVVPAGDQLDYWCVNVVVDDPAQEGYNFLFYVKDSGDGMTTFDELAFGGGPGASCAANAPSYFSAIEGGDFKTQLKYKK